MNAVKAGLGIFVSGVFLAAAALCAAQEGRTREITVRAAIDMAAAENLRVQAGRLGPEIARLMLRAEKSVYVPSLGLSASYVDSNAPLTSYESLLAGGLSSLEQKDTVVGADISARLPYGTKVSLFTQTTASESVFNSFDSEYSGYAGVMLSQPLLKGGGRDANDYKIRTRSVEEKISALSLRSTVISELADVRRMYWDIVSLEHALDFAKTDLELAEKLYSDTQKSVDAGMVSKLDLVQAKAGVAARREAILVGERNLRNASNLLSNMLGEKGRDIAWKPTDSPVILELDLDTAKWTGLALANRPEYLMAKLQLEIRGHDVDYYRNQVWPEVNVEGKFTLLGTGTGTGDYGEDVGDSDTREWSVGLKISQPLSLSGPMSMLRAAKLNRESQALGIRDLEDLLGRRVENAVGTVITNRFRVESTGESLKYAREALEAENMKYAAGKSTSGRVLDYQSDMMAALLANISAMVDYRKSIVDLEVECGLLPEHMRGEEGEVLAAAESGPEIEKVKDE